MLNRLAQFLFSISICLFCSTSVVCFGISPPLEGDLPWFTGPLFTPSARLVEKGHVNIEPYILWREINGHYDNNWNASSTPKINQIITELPIKWGIADKFNISFLFTSQYKWNKKTSSAGLGDFVATLEYQLYNNKSNEFAIKVYLQEIFPTGKYRKLHATKMGTDSFGGGSFITIAGITFSKLFHLNNNHYLKTRLNIAETFPSEVHVKGINSYGGDPSTNGKVFPGNTFAVLFGAEYTLTKNWVLAIDIISLFSSKTRFKGNTLLPVNHPSSAQFTAAPAIEYNFSQTIGIIAGPWFTFAGRNSDRFHGFVAALNWYF